MKIDLAYGRASYVKKFSFSKNIFICSGNINLLEEFPVLFFECSIIFNNDKFLKKPKDKIETLKLNIFGNLNILNNKINFKKFLQIKITKLQKEDLKYYKNFLKIYYLTKTFSKYLIVKK